MPKPFDALLPALDDVIEKHVKPNAARRDREAIWPKDAIATLQARGFGGLVVPSEQGGLDQKLSGLIRFCERVATADASTAICFGMHCVATACIAAKASPRQIASFIEPICTGKHLTTLALSEPGTGSHFYLPQAQFTRTHQDDFRINGSKCFVTNGAQADSYVLSAVDSCPDTDVGHFSLLLVPNKTPGLQWDDAWRGFGMRGNASLGLRLQDVSIPSDSLLGNEGDQIWYVFHVVAPYFLAAMAGTYLGVAKHAFEILLDHLKTRQHAHNRKRLADSEVLQNRVGRLWTTLKRTQQLCYWAAHEADSGGPEALPAICSAKAEVAEATVEIANEAMTLCGGIAYREDATLQQLLRDARAAHVMSPTTDLLFNWIGRSSLGIPLLAE